MKQLALALFLILPARAEEPGAAAVAQTRERHTVRSSVGPTDIPLSLELSNFLMDHPDFTASIVNKRKIAPYTVTMRGPRSFWADDGYGTQGLITLMEHKENYRLYYGEGSHKGRLFPLLRAAGVIVMKMEAQTGKDCRPSTKASFSVFVHVKNRFVAGVLTLLRPFLQKTIDGKFRKAFSAAERIGRLLEKDPQTLNEDVRASRLLSSKERASLLKLIEEFNATSRCL